MLLINETNLLLHKIKILLVYPSFIDNIKLLLFLGALLILLMWTSDYFSYIKSLKKTIHKLATIFFIDSIIKPYVIGNKDITETMSIWGYTYADNIAEKIKNNKDTSASLLIDTEKNFNKIAINTPFHRDTTLYNYVFSSRIFQYIENVLFVQSLKKHFLPQSIYKILTTDGPLSAGVSLLVSDDLLTSFEKSIIAINKAINMLSEKLKGEYINLYNNFQFTSIGLDMNDTISPYVTLVFKINSNSIPQKKEQGIIVDNITISLNDILIEKEMTEYYENLLKYDVAPALVSSIYYMYVPIINSFISDITTWQLMSKKTNANVLLSNYWILSQPFVKNINLMYYMLGLGIYGTEPIKHYSNLLTYKDTLNLGIYKITKAVSKAFSIPTYTEDGYMFYYADDTASSKLLRIFALYSLPYDAPWTNNLYAYLAYTTEYLINDGDYKLNLANIISLKHNKVIADPKESKDIMHQINMYTAAGKKDNKAKQELNTLLNTFLSNDNNLQNLITSLKYYTQHTSNLWSHRYLALHIGAPYYLAPMMYNLAQTLGIYKQNDENEYFVSNKEIASAISERYKIATNGMDVLGLMDMMEYILYSSKNIKRLQELRELYSKEIKQHYNTNTNNIFDIAKRQLYKVIIAKNILGSFMAKYGIAHMKQFLEYWKQYDDTYSMESSLDIIIKGLTGTGVALMIIIIPLLFFTHISLDIKITTALATIVTGLLATNRNTTIYYRYLRETVKEFTSTLVIPHPLYYYKAYYSNLISSDQTHDICVQFLPKIYNVPTWKNYYKYFVMKEYFTNMFNTFIFRNLLYGFILWIDIIIITINVFNWSMVVNIYSLLALYIMAFIFSSFIALHIDTFIKHETDSANLAIYGEAIINKAKPYRTTLNPTMMVGKMHFQSTTNVSEAFTDASDIYMYMTKYISNDMILKYYQNTDAFNKGKPILINPFVLGYDDEAYKQNIRKLYK